MISKDNIKCTQCANEIHWLEVFPNNVCLPCHARKHENDTPAQMLAAIADQFGGKQ